MKEKSFRLTRIQYYDPMHTSPVCYHRDNVATRDISELTELKEDIMIT
jgi:hypothetical protein